MSSLSTAHNAVVSATTDEQPIIDRVVEVLRNEPAEARITLHPGEEILLPPSLRRVLQEAAWVLMRGDDVSIVPIHKQLTTQEAADLLNVSRQYLVRLLESGEIPFTKTGTHRRIGYADLMAYKQQRDARRRAGLAELTHLSQEMGQYD